MKPKWQDKAAGHPRGEGGDRTDGSRGMNHWLKSPPEFFAFSYLGRERTNEKRTKLLSSFIFALEWIIRQLGLLKVGKARGPEDLCSWFQRRVEREAGKSLWWEIGWCLVVRLKGRARLWHCPLQLPGQKGTQETWVVKKNLCEDGQSLEQQQGGTSGVKAST